MLDTPPITETQHGILQRMKKGHQLKGNHEVEDGNWRLATFMWLYVPVSLSLQDGSVSVTLEDVQALQRLHLIEVKNLKKDGLAGVPGRIWRNWTVNYELTELGKEFVQEEEGLNMKSDSPKIDLDILLEVAWNTCNQMRDKRIGEHLIQIMPQELLYFLASHMDEQAMRHLRAQGMTNDYVAEWVDRQKQGAQVK